MNADERSPPRAGLWPQYLLRHKGQHPKKFGRRTNPLRMRVKRGNRIHSYLRSSAVPSFDSPLHDRFRSSLRCCRHSQRLSLAIELQFKADQFRRGAWAG